MSDNPLSAAQTAPDPAPSIDAASLGNAVAAISSAQKIVLACHINPDGDALGSVLALGTAIRTTHPTKDVTMISRDGVPEIYRFLPNHDLIQQNTERRDFDLAIVLDSGDLSRVGDQVVPAIMSAPVQMDIDHHVGDGAFGKFRLLNSRAAATAEIVFDLIGELGAAVTPDIARCLLTGVITDTGSFRFMNVTPRTLRIAATLIEAGASPALIAEQVFDNRHYSSTKLMGITLASLSQTPDGLITWAHVSVQDFTATGATDEDTEGLVGFVRAVRGTEIAMLFRETKPGVIRISLRSAEGRDVSLIANQFGGGGHRMAAGCSFHGALADAETALVEAAKASINL